MKLLLALLSLLGLSLLGLPLLVVAVIATHPWLAVGALTAPVQVVEPTPTPAPAPTRAAVPTQMVGGDLGDVVGLAREWLGVPYIFGGCSRRGVDCSCLVQLVYRALGVTLPRVAADQFGATARVSREDLAPGDLVFFANTYM